MAYDDNIYAKIVSGELTGSELKALKASGEWDEIQEILNVASTLELPSHNKQKGYEALKKRKLEQSKPPIIRRIRPYIVGVAAILVGVFAYVFLFNSTIEVEAKRGEFYAVSLPDNSKVELNSGSKLSYSKSQGRDGRQVSLQGEALFEVESGNAFLVETSNGNVEVLGTVFNVKSWNGQFEVECFEGRVSVKVDDSSVILNQGEATRLFGILEEPFTIDHKAPNWKDGFSRFDDQPIRNVFDELERQYDITVESANLGSRFSGTFQYDDLNTALEDICKPLNLSFTFVNNDTVIISE